MDDEQKYFVVKGRKWRKTDPTIPENLRQELVNELMSARRAVKTAMANNDELLKSARQRVNDAKIALGERGQPWWEPQSEEDLILRIRSAILALLRSRKQKSSICPSDAAKIVGASEWRNIMGLTRKVGRGLANEMLIKITQNGKPVGGTIVGPCRFSRANNLESE